MVVHVCPVCGSRHEVHSILDRLACGNQLTCSPHCKTAFARLVRNRLWWETADRKKFSNPREEDN